MNGAGEAQSLQELERVLSSAQMRGSEVLAWTSDETQRLLQAERACIYGISEALEGLRVDYGHYSGFSMSAARCRSIMNEALGRAGAFAAYDALRPAAHQRGRVLAFPSVQALIDAPVEHPLLKASERAALSARVRNQVQMFQRLSVIEHRQLRILICDGPRLLGWFGIFDMRPFSRRQRTLLRTIAPWLGRRLRFERELRGAPMSEVLMDAAFDAIGAPALVIGAGGTIVHANESARSLLDARSSEVLRLLEQVLDEGSAPGVDVFDVSACGLPRTRMVILRAHVARDAARCAAIIRMWRLTPREAEVLALVVAGDTNREIATTLGCAEATVEIHVSRLLRKAGVETRTALVTAFWAPG